MHRLKCLYCNKFGDCQTNVDFTKAANDFFYDSAKREEYNEAHDLVSNCEEFTKRKRCDI